MNIDIFVFCVFLIKSLFVGFCGNTVKAFKHYVVGIKKFNTATLAITIITTSYGGGGLLVISLLICDNKFNSLFEVVCSWTLIFCIVVLLIGWVFIPHMGAVLGHLSIAESIGHFYGSKLRIITAIYDLLRIITGNVLKCKLIGKLAYLIGLDRHWTIMVTISVLLCSVTFGGILSITLINTFQFCITGIFTLVLSTLILHYHQDVINIYNIFSHHPYFNSAFKMHIMKENPILIVVSLFYTIFLLLSSLVQHVYRIKDTAQGRRSFTLASCFAFVVGFFFILLILILCSNGSFQEQSILKNILQIYSNFSGFKGLMWIFIIIGLLSSIGSELNTAAVLITHDIIHVLIKNFNKKLVVVRYFFVLLGILVVILTIYVKHLFITIILCISLCCSTFINFLFFMAILGFQFRTNFILYSMIISIFTIISLTILAKYNFIAICFLGIGFLGIIIYLFILFGSDYLAVSGWVGIKEKDVSILDQYKQKRKINRILNISIIHVFVHYLYKVVPFSTKRFFYFGIYILVSYFIALFGICDINYLPYYMYAMGSGVFFIVLPSYAPSFYKNSRSIIIFWMVSIFLLLFFGGPINFMMNGYTKLHGSIIMLHIVVGNLLLPFYLVVLLFFVGYSVAYFWCGAYAEVSFVQLWLFTHPEFTHLLTACMLLLLSMVKWYKEQKSILQKIQYIRSLELENKIYKIPRGLYYQDSLDQIVSYSNFKKQFENLHLKILGTTSDHDLKTRGPHRDILNMMFSQNNNFSPYLEDRSYYDKNALPLHIHTIALHCFLDNVEDTLHLLYKDIFFVYSNNIQKQNIVIQGDVNQLKYLLVQSARYLYENNVSKGTIIQVNVLPTILQYTLHIPSRDKIQNIIIKEIPAVGIQFTTLQTIPGIALSYAGDLGKDSKDNFQVKINHVGLRESERIIDAHYGYIEIRTIEDKTACLYVLPQDVSMIRNDVMKGLQSINKHEIYETSISIVQEKELIKLIKTKGIFKDVKEHLREDFLLVEIFLFMKKCHGTTMRRFTNEPNYTFAMDMATILLHIHITYSPALLVATLLHDTIQVAPVSLCYLRSKYGYHVALLIDKLVSSMEHITHENQEQERAQYHHLQDDDSMDVMILKLVRCLANIRSEVMYEKKEKKAILIKETLEKYVPLAQQMGIQWIEKELIKRCEALEKNSTLIIV